MEQLGLAYRHLWHHGWPQTLEEALAKPGYRIAITQVARNMNRRSTAAQHLHGLPRPAVPPTPAVLKTGRHARSEYSLATGPHTDLASWVRTSPKAMMYSQPRNPRQPFDVRKAAANDLDD